MVGGAAGTRKTTIALHSVLGHLGQVQGTPMLYVAFNLWLGKYAKRVFFDRLSSAGQGAASLQADESQSAGRDWEVAQSRSTPIVSSNQRSALVRREAVLSLRQPDLLGHRPQRLGLEQQSPERTTSRY